jgi:hypothetical protein
VATPHFGAPDVFGVALSREDLLYQTVSSQVERMLAGARVYLAPDVPLPAMLEGLSASTFDYVLQHPLVLQVLRGTLEVGPAWAERFARLRERCLEPVVHALRLGIQQGVLREDLEVEEVASLLFELHAAGYLAPRTGSGAGERAERRREVALDLVLRGMLRQEG